MDTDGLMLDSERAHYLMQSGTYFSDLVDLEGMRIAFSRTISNPWYNQAYDVRLPITAFAQAIERVESILREHNRIPCVYLTPGHAQSQFGHLLMERGYELMDSEAWMYCVDSTDLELWHPPTSIQIARVQTETQLADFLSIYEKVLDAPEVAHFLRAVQASFRYPPAHVEIYHFVGSCDGTPASILSLFSLGRYAALYDVATVSEFRGRGVLRAMMKSALIKAKGEGAQHIFLQTTSGEACHAIFERLGFRTRFVRLGYGLGNQE